MVAVISVKIPNPQFEGQTKEKLLNPEVEGVVSSTVGEALSTWCEEHPGEAKKICQKAVMAAQADLVSIEHTLKQVVCVKG